MSKIIKISGFRYLVRPPEIPVRIIARSAGTVLFEGPAPRAALDLAVPEGDVAVLDDTYDPAP